MPASVWLQARPVLLSAAAVAVLGGGLSAGCGRGAHANTTEKPKAAELPVITAAVLEVQPASWPAVVRTQGSLAADEVAIVGAKVAGRVNEVNFDLGDAIRAGTVLAALDQEDFKLQVILAE